MMKLGLEHVLRMGETDSIKIKFRGGQIFEVWKRNTVALQGQGD